MKRGENMTEEEMLEIARRRVWQSPLSPHRKQLALDDIELQIGYDVDEGTPPDIDRIHALAIASIARQIRQLNRKGV